MNDFVVFVLTVFCCFTAYWLYQKWNENGVVEITETTDNVKVQASVQSSSNDKVEDSPNTNPYKPVFSLPSIPDSISLPSECTRPNCRVNAAMLSGKFFEKSKQIDDLVTLLNESTQVYMRGRRALVRYRKDIREKFAAVFCPSKDIIQKDSLRYISYLLLNDRAEYKKHFDKAMNVVFLETSMEEGFENVGTMVKRIFNRVESILYD